MWWLIPVGILVLLVLYFISSINILEANEVGAISTLGEPSREEGSGPHLVWRFFQKIRRFSTVAEQRQFPGEPEEVQRYDDLPLEGWQVTPIHITHAPADQALFYSWQPTEDEIKDGPTLKLADIERDDTPRYKAIMADPLSLRLTSEASFTIKIHLVKGKLFQFIQNADGDIEKVFGWLRDMEESLLQSILTKTTLAESLRVKEEISGYIQALLEEFVGEKELDLLLSHTKNSKTEEMVAKHGKPLGVVIDDTTIVNLFPGRRVNEAMSDAAVALKKREEKISQAEAEAQEIRLKADADAHAITVKGNAEAEAIKKVATEMKDPHAVMARRLDVLQVAFANPKLIVADGAVKLMALFDEIGKEVK
ncbi:MAG: SPFH domain-containing protein [Patescibacteria group bacterium]